MTPDPGWEYLLTDAGRQCVDEATAQHREGISLDALGQTLRKQGIEGAIVAATLTQVGLRAKAHAKFGELAERLLFTQAGLEQATRHLVANEHAARFQRAGVQSVTDLGCGLGAESLALQMLGITVRAVERDPFTAALARHNLSTLSGAPPAEVLVGDAEALGTGESQGAFLDPARRTAGHTNTRRVASPDDYSPSLGFAFDIARALPTGIKLGPGLDRDLIPDELEAQWVSVNGSVVETCLWSREVAREHVARSALVIDTHGDTVVRHELTAPQDAPDAEAGALGAFVYEPDGSVIRARLIGMLASEIHARMIDPHIAYMTADTHTPTPFAQAFRIIEEAPVQEKALKKFLSTRDIGALEIKKRGVDVHPETLRQRLKLRGSESATLIMTRVGNTRTAWLCERV